LLQGSFSTIRLIKKQISTHLLHCLVLNNLYALSALIVVVSFIPHQLNKLFIHFGIAFVLFVDTLQKLLFWALIRLLLSLLLSERVDVLLFERIIGNFLNGERIESLALGFASSILLGLFAHHSIWMVYRVFFWSSVEWFLRCDRLRLWLPFYFSGKGSICLKKKMLLHKKCVTLSKSSDISTSYGFWM
jgi:hypothetical protein